MINIDDRIIDEYDEKEIYLLLIITRMMQKNRSAWPSLSTLMDETGWSKNTVLRVRRALEKKDAIETAKRMRKNGSNTSNEYKVIADGIGFYVPVKNVMSSSSIGEPSKLVQELNKDASDNEPSKLVQELNDKEQVNNSKSIKERTSFEPPDKNEVYKLFKKLMTDRAIKEPRLWAIWETKKFFEHYEQVNWKTGRNKMRDWNRAVQGWFRRALEKSTFNKRCPDDPLYSSDPWYKNDSQTDQNGEKLVYDLRVKDV